MHFNFDVLIIGGGLAGLTTALHLNKVGIAVVLIEKNPYPHHKVCGEYLSNEVLPYFKWLGIELENLNPTQISRLALTTKNGKNITVNLPLGGFGISRYELDHFLYQKLIERGVMVIEDTVDEVVFKDDQFFVNTKLHRNFEAKHVCGAYGKRSLIDIKLNRNFIKEKSAFLAVKAHYEGDFPEDMVALYTFDGGYCGVSKVENRKINICYLANYETFKRFKNLEEYQQEVLCKNLALKHIFDNCKIAFEAPLTISQLSFGSKDTIVNHVLMIGDTAGLIHPLCGNGMAMAIHSGKICAELLIDFSNGKIKTREKLAQRYTAIWNKNFKGRLRTGSLLSYLLKKESITHIILKGLTKIPFLLTQVIKNTHGKPLINK